MKLIKHSKPLGQSYIVLVKLYFEVVKERPIFFYVYS